MQTDTYITIEEIIKDYDIILLDCSFDCNDQFCISMYNCWDSNMIPDSIIKERIRYFNDCIDPLFYTDNTYTIPEVIQELDQFQDILNSYTSYHNNVIKKKRSGRKIKHKKNKNQKFRSYSVNDDEIGSVRSLDEYSDKVFKLIRYLRNNQIKVNDLALINKIRQSIKEEDIKRDYRHRYQTKNLRSDNIKKRDSDEKLLITAYKKNQLENSTAIITNDSDLIRLASHCFIKNLIDPPKKEFAIFTDYDSEHIFKKNVF